MGFTFVLQHPRSNWGTSVRSPPCRNTQRFKNLNGWFVFKKYLGMKKIDGKSLPGIKLKSCYYTSVSLCLAHYYYFYYYVSEQKLSDMTAIDVEFVSLNDFFLEAFSCLRLKQKWISLTLKFVCFWSEKPILLIVTQHVNTFIHWGLKISLNPWNGINLMVKIFIFQPGLVLDPERGLKMSLDLVLLLKQLWTSCRLLNTSDPPSPRRSMLELLPVSTSPERLSQRLLWKFCWISEAF